MSGIFGLLGLDDTDRAFVNTLGQRVVYDAIGQLFEQHNADLMAAMSVFVDGETEDFKFRYKLPGGGYLSRRGGQAQSPNVKRTGSWDVALPLEDFGAAIGGDDVTLAYMTVQELNTHLQTIMQQNINTTRLEILKALLDNVSYTFVDEIHGSLSVVALANGDGVLYPPVLGTSSEAEETHHIETNYAPGSISDTNDPYVTAANELEEHFGAPTAGSNIVQFINPDAVAKTRDLAAFVPVTDMGVMPGQDTATVLGLPGNLPGRLLGRHEEAGVWIAEWRWVPATYQIAIHLDAPKPLRMRVDPANTGLARGLNLVSTSDAYPLQNSHYRNRFGVAVVNRLNGVVLELGTGGTYSVPSGYSH